MKQTVIPEQPDGENKGYKIGCLAIAKSRLCKPIQNVEVYFDD